MDRNDPQKLINGALIKPEGWVLKDRISSKTSGQQWLAERQNSQAVLYFPPTSMIENKLLLDEWERRSRALIGVFSDEFQKVFEVSTRNKNMPFCVIESIEGKRLDHLQSASSQRCISADLLQKLLEPVINALASEHRQMRFHGSLSPDSFLINRRGEMRILNHIWRALFCDLEQRAKGSKSALEATYLSPQQLDGRRIRASDDQYSLAATMYEFLTSEPPFVSEDSRASVPDFLDFAIFKALSKNPNDRFDSVITFWKKAWDHDHHISKKIEKVENENSENEDHEIENSENHESQNDLSEIDDHEIGDHENDESQIDDHEIGVSKDPILKTEASSSEQDFEQDSYSLPPPPIFKRFSTPFVLVALMMALTAIFLVKHYQNSLIKNEDSDLSSMPDSSIPNASTNLPNDEFVPENVGWLEVKTEPVSAIVELWFNHREIPIEGITPIMFSNLPAGELEICLSRKGYLETNFFTKVEIGKTNHIQSRLQTQFGKVDLSSDPKGVSYIICQGKNEIRSGICPDEFALPIGFYEIKYLFGKRQKSNYLKVEEDKIAHPNVSFEAGKLSVKTIPKSAEVFLGEEFMGMSPMIITNLSPGKHQLILKSARHRLITLNVFVKHKVETLISKKLDPMLKPEPKKDWINSLGMHLIPLSDTGNLLGAFEVREGLFRSFLEDSSEPFHTRFPVVNVSFKDAMAFCKWLTKREREDHSLLQNQFYRLPKSSEWDKAASPFSSEKSIHIHSQLAPVGKIASNRFGFFDLTGNVKEWCLGGIIRGASWRTSEQDRLSINFESPPPETRRDDLGFRVLLDMKTDVKKDVKTK